MDMPKLFGAPESPPAQLTELPARPARHPGECDHCRKAKGEVQKPRGTSSTVSAYISELEHTIRVLAAVAGEKGARPPDLTTRENQVVSLCMKLSPDDGYA